MTSLPLLLIYGGVLLCVAMIYIDHERNSVPSESHHINAANLGWDYRTSRPHHRMRIIKRALDDMGEEFDKAWRAA